MRCPSAATARIIALALSLAVACSRPQASALRSVEFDGEAASIRVRSGWSGSERTADGASFCWAEGREAILATAGVVPQPYRVSIRAWSFNYAEAPPQRLTLFINDTRVAEIVVSSAPTEHSFETPWSVWASQENVLRFKFSRADAPKDRVAGSADARPLSVAFDWVRVVPWLH